MLTRTCPHCTQETVSNDLTCRHCERVLAPLPTLLASRTPGPSVFLDGVFCLLAALGIIGMIVSTIVFFNNSASPFKQSIALLVFIGSLSLMIMAVRKSNDFVEKTSSH